VLVFLFASDSFFKDEVALKLEAQQSQITAMTD